MKVLNKENQKIINKLNEIIEYLQYKKSILNINHVFIIQNNKTKINIDSNKIQFQISNYINQIKNNNPNESINIKFQIPNELNNKLSWNIELTLLLKNLRLIKNVDTSLALNNKPKNQPDIEINYVENIQSLNALLIENKIPKIIKNQITNILYKNEKNIKKLNNSTDPLTKIKKSMWFYLKLYLQILDVL